jgi:hypothetical protein
MIKRIALLIPILFVFSSSSAPQTKGIEHLRDVHTIYVDKLGESDASNMIREKIINRLVRSKRLTVVDDVTQADAILTGAAEAHESLRVSEGTGHTRHISSVAARLITQDKQILWVNETKTGKWRWSDDADEKLVKELLDAIKKDEKAKP